MLKKFLLRFKLILLVNRGLLFFHEYRSQIRENWQALARDKMAKTLSYHDEQFHVLEKYGTFEFPRL